MRAYRKGEAQTSDERVRVCAGWEDAHTVGWLVGRSVLAFARLEEKSLEKAERERERVEALSTRRAVASRERTSGPMARGNAEGNEWDEWGRARVVAMVVEWEMRHATPRGSSTRAG